MYDFLTDDWEMGYNQDHEFVEICGKAGTDIGNWKIQLAYALSAADAVERKTYGTELVETSSFSGNAEIELNKEILLGSWSREQKVEQTIGIPFLCRIPVLKYLFGTDTVSTEKSFVCVTVHAELLDTGTSSFLAGKLARLK